MMSQNLCHSGNSAQPPPPQKKCARTPMEIVAGCLELCVSGAY